MNFTSFLEIEKNIKIEKTVVDISNAFDACGYPISIVKFNHNK